MPGSGRRRQPAAPLGRRLRLDLLAWGVLAAVGAALVLGLTGGGWGSAAVLGLLVLGGFTLLVLLTTMSSSARAKRSARRRGDPPAP